MSRNRVFAAPYRVWTGMAVAFAVLAADVSAEGPGARLEQTGAAAAAQALDPLPRVLSDPDLSDQVNSTFNLATSTLVALDIAAEPEQDFTAVVPIRGELMTLELSPHS
ncbi:MAG: hypothetical protein ACE5EC_04860, partial [Phycisphaerae bacterium]